MESIDIWPIRKSISIGTINTTAIRNELMLVRERVLKYIYFNNLSSIQTMQAEKTDVRLFAYGTRMVGCDNAIKACCKSQCRHKTISAKFSRANNKLSGLWTRENPTNSARRQRAHKISVTLTQIKHAPKSMMNSKMFAYPSCMHASHWLKS